MWVVKIGGSLAFSPALPDFLAALHCKGKIRPVVAPGGGPFADEVRRTQKLLGFDEATAHRMAILATEQYGLMFCALAPHLVPAASRAEIAESHARGLVPVWMAVAMTKDRSDIGANWDVTSDSLAAWLAAKIGAAALVLVKSADPPPPPVTASTLAAGGFVDKAFPEFVAGKGFALRWLGPGGAQELARGLESGTLPGVAVAA